MNHGLDPEQRQQISRRSPQGRLGTPGHVLPLADFAFPHWARLVPGLVFVVDGGITT